jgi:DNA-binding IclR family transcriptional regulator
MAERRRGTSSGTPEPELAPGHQPVKSAARTVELLEHLARAGGMHSLRDLQLALGHPKSSLHALLRTLVEAGWVESDQTGTLYGMGLRALLVGMSYIDGDESVALASSSLTWLATETSETIHLARLDGTDVVYLATRDSTHELRVVSRIGHRLPAHSTALGKALLAERSDDELKAVLPKRLDALTPHTITDRSKLLAELAETRKRGYAIDRQENTLGLRCIGIAIGRHGPARDAISCSVPLSRLDAEREAELVRLLRAARERIARESWSLGPVRDGDHPALGEKGGRA